MGGFQKQDLYNIYSNLTLMNQFYNDLCNNHPDLSLVLYKKQNYLTKFLIEHYLYLKAFLLSHSKHENLATLPGELEQKKIHISYF
jgi:hypothetical protein